MAGAVLRIADAARVVVANLRDPDLRAAQVSFLLAWTAEWAFTVGIGIAAFRGWGALGVGIVGLVRMIPAAAVSPFAAPLADRFRRERVLAVIALVRAGCAGGVAAVVATGFGPALYVLAVLATVAGTLYRAVHSALLPSLCRTAQQLAGANVTRGLLDSVATFLGPLLATVLLGFGSLSAVFLVAAAASALAAPMVMLVRYEPTPRESAPQPVRVLADARTGIAAIVHEPSLVLMFGLDSVQTFTRGALSVFVVVVAIELLGAGEAGAGLLTTAVGAGAVLGSLAAALLADSRFLATWFGIGCALWGLPIALTGAFPFPAAALALLAWVGIGNALVDIGLYTLTARLVPDDVMARVFGVLESIVALGAAAGSLAAPLVIQALGLRGAMVAIGVLLPMLVLLSVRRLRALDATMAERDARVALLAAVPMMRPLPMPAIEHLARTLDELRVTSGTQVVRQGEPGDAFYVIARGSAVVLRNGREVRRLGPGDGFGEVALLRDGQRSATVRAVEDLHLRVVHRTQFVAAITGYTRSRREAEALIASLELGQGPRPDHEPGASQAGPDPS